ncbi:uncharacterized protein LOC132729265 [Ruditapes philippinarum]|uniref:uncharacterized protein LOC132729265 n=1 Tax=Ruditapes philippinarum TaxID=129788 RepID=UPI00295BBEF3|nr:uncharacterized protein LOC132729265 [Ruditapes philippinarum]
MRQTCSSGTTTGSTSLLKKISKVDTNTAETFVHTDSQYFFKCCGVVEQWQLHAENPGTVNLQVWRPVGSTLKLMGQNTFYVASEGTKTLPVPVSERVTVQYADYIGWYSDAEMITYSDGSASDAFSLAITYDTAFYSGGSVANWGSANRHSNRLYAVLAVVTASERTSPTLSDLSIPREFFQYNLRVGDTVLVAYVYDVDKHDLEYMTFIRIDAHDAYFEMKVSQNSTHAYVEFLILNIPPFGNYTFQFEAKDSCFNSVSGSAEIIIKRRNLSIKNLPYVVTTHLQKPGPLSLRKLVVQTDALFTCTIDSVSPAVPSGLIIIDTSGVSVVAPPVLSAPETYNIGVLCTDSEGTEDKQTLTVNTVINTEPRVVGFVDSVFVDVLQTSVNDVVHKNVIVDDEDDEVDVLYICDQNPCPFKLLKSGNVICIDDLASVNETTYTMHFGLSDGNLFSDEYILNIYLQNFNVAPYISNLSPGIDNTITVSETTEVGTDIFDVDGKDGNPSDNMFFSFQFDSPEANTYFAYSTKDGTLTLTSQLNYTYLQSFGLDKFSVKINVTDGLLTSDDYHLTIIVSVYYSQEQNVKRHECYYRD